MLKVSINHSAVPECLKKLDASYGVTFMSPSGLKVKNDSLSTKLLKLLERTFFDTNSTNKNNAISALSKTLEFSKTHNLTNGVSVQINQNSQLSQWITSNLSFLKYTRWSYLLDAFSTEKTHLFPYYDHMVIGEDSFTDRSSFFKSASDFISQEDLVSLAFFHELSHHFNHKNTNETVYGTCFDFLLEKLNPNQKWNVDFINEGIRNNNSHISLLDNDFISKIKTTFDEMYADTSAILYLRNYWISTNSYSDDKYDNLLKGLTHARLYNVKLLTSSLKDREISFKAIFKVVDHFTSPALMTFKIENPDTLRSEEIHKKAIDASRIGMANLFLILGSSSDILKRQIDTLMGIRYTEVAKRKEKDHTMYFDELHSEFTRQSMREYTSGDLRRASTCLNPNEHLFKYMIHNHYYLSNADTLELFKTKMDFLTDNLKLKLTTCVIEDKPLLYHDYKIMEEVIQKEIMKIEIKLNP